MISTVYLILIFTGGTGMMTSQQIPQSNMTQCLTNVKNFNDKPILSKIEYRKVITAICVVGVK